MIAFLSSLRSILPIIILITIGYLMQRAKWFDNSFSNNISKLIMNIALPASVFTAVLKYLTIDVLLELSTGFLYTVIAMTLWFLVGYLFSKILKIRTGRRGSFISMFAISNTLFIGLPLNMALFGEKGLPYFLVYYIVSTIATWTVSVIIIANDSPTKIIKSKIEWKKLLPLPLIACILGICFVYLNLKVPIVIESTLTYLGNMVTPLSLMYIGIISAKSNVKNIKLDLDTIMALVGRFVIAPLIMFFVIKLGGSYFTQIVNIEYQIFMVQSATAGAAVMPILVNEAGGDVEYATNVITLSMFLCIIVVPLITAIW